MKIERMMGCKEISQRLADAIENEHPNSRHIFPDSSFILFGPTDYFGTCDGLNPARKKQI